jgi:hypothetical protein
MSEPTSEPIRVTAPEKTKADEVLEESFYKDLAAQSERLDKFALELIKLQLAIPALYAGILKLVDNKDAVAAKVAAEEVAKATTVGLDSTVFLGIFIPWLIALVLSFAAVFPMQRYEVKANPIIEPLPANSKGVIAINAYWHFSARRKFKLLAVSSFLSFFGIAVAIFNSI